MSKGKFFTKDIFDFDIDQAFSKWGIGTKSKKR